MMGLICSKNILLFGSFFTCLGGRQWGKLWSVTYCSDCTHKTQHCCSGGGTAKQVLPRCSPECKVKSIIWLIFGDLSSERRVAIYNLSLVLSQMVLDFVPWSSFIHYFVNKDVEKMNVLFSVLGLNFFLSTSPGLLMIFRWFVSHLTPTSGTSLAVQLIFIKYHS